MQEISFRDDILPLKDKLFRLALRITLDRAEAEDVVQDTMIRVWSKREEWTQFGSVEAYCLTSGKEPGDRPESEERGSERGTHTSKWRKNPEATGPYDRIGSMMNG